MITCNLVECCHRPRYSPKTGVLSWECYSVAYNPASTAPIAHAIDSKIEQAMDLVKTHLMFAVREEVDTLRHKIHDLETNVQKLELENTILKKHVPEEVLRSLNRH